MAREDRTGNRKKREQCRINRNPEMGYYLIITDTEATERLFFEGLHDSFRDEDKSKLIIRVVETKTKNMIQKCREMTAYEAQYRIPWIVFDRDKVEDFDNIISKAEESGINIGWSNPCFEIWLFAYFGKMPVIWESWRCCTKFSEVYKLKTGQDYSKADSNLYRHLCESGDEEKAIKIATQKYEQCIRDGKKIPSNMCPATTVHELVGEIRGKVKR